jgi:hypothetical protein
LLVACFKTCDENEKETEGDDQFGPPCFSFDCGFAHYGPNKQKEKEKKPHAFE